MINRFRGDYFFLSNFYPASIIYDNMLFLNNEAAFQAGKVTDVETKRSFQSIGPSKAKSIGRRVPLRSDWEDVKYDIMYEICLAKFTQHKDLADKLLATGNKYLQEENSWGDKVWGTVNGEGQNMLGKILMKVRDELRAKNNPPKTQHTAKFDDFGRIYIPSAVRLEIFGVSDVTDKTMEISCTRDGVIILKPINNTTNIN